MTKPMCEFVKANGQPCGNRAAWRCWYREPDRPNALRRRFVSLRCHWHAWDLKFFPAGSSQLDNLGINVVTPEALASTATEPSRPASAVRW